MNAEQFLAFLTQALFVVVFLLVLVQVARRPRRITLDTALLFGAVSLLVAEGWITQAFGITPGTLLVAASSSCIMALPYLLIRLVDDFATIPRWVPRAAVFGLAVSVISLFLLTSPYPLIVTLLYVLYFFAFTVYAAAAFVRAARRSSGVTRRRMQAVAAGSLSLGLAIFVAGVSAADPAGKVWWSVLAQICALGSGLGYFLGFTPPDWLRRTWQEPEVRAFLGRAATLPRLPDTSSIVRELEHGAASAFGVQTAVIGLWNESTQTLRYDAAMPPVETTPNQMIAGRAFVAQRPIFSEDAVRDDPANAEAYRRSGAQAIMAAPVTAGEKRLGVLAVYTAHAPIFADDDLGLVALLADQAAVILESRALIDEAARVRAREEATRLKDDFLSAAAHDLKTPLTAVVAQAQLLEHRARRRPDAPADLDGIQRIVKESQRLTRLVLELLDVSRVEQGKLVAHRENVDLVSLVQDACARYTSPRHTCELDARGEVAGVYDANRIMQLVDNLLENAIKYSPDGGDICVTLWRSGDQAHLTVTDHGIGIAPADLPHLFERFHRGSNVDDRHFAGLGLGLFICRGIVEQHGGTIAATSPGIGKGSTFHVTLPATDLALSNAEPSALPLDSASVVGDMRP